ncbi:c-type cytochrome [Pseudoalteromonas sp. SSM20]|uniref:c-type cytochrome n=1 Tax=Pseudoalteromonas sp. SSM20 TaxID=3139394 RepID=UPI003BA8C368
MKKLTAALLMMSATVAVAAPFDNSLTEEAIKKRIAPVGSVYLAGAEPVVAEPTGPRTGQQVYQASCFGCHGTGALGAPKTKADWDARLAKGMDVLMQHAINGFNAMPPRGTCMNCSDDEIKGAIEFMAQGN